MAEQRMQQQQQQKTKKKKKKKRKQMMPPPFFFFFFLGLSSLLTLPMEIISSAHAYSPPDNYLLKCGTDQAAIAIDNRVWQGDGGSSFISSSADNSLSAVILSSPIPLLNTSRIFTRRSSYVLPVSSLGLHWLRLYFYSFSYLNFTRSAATFSVTADEYTLLHEFNPSVEGSSTSSSPNSFGNYSGFSFKEYLLNLTKSPLEISFIPSNSTSDSYAFVNAIEMVSAPERLISGDSTFTLGGGADNSSALSTPSMGFETMYRLNVGGSPVVPLNDTPGLSRTWFAEESYLASKFGVEEINSTISSILYQRAGSDENIAPPSVYSTALQINNPQETSSLGFNLSWSFGIDPNYVYFVRFHLCELEYGTGGKRHFNLFLQNQTAYSQLDLGQEFGHYSAIHIDILLQAGADDSRLLVQAGPPPNTGSNEFTEAIVNGIEVWKVSNSEGSFDRVAMSAPIKSVPGTSSSKPRVMAIAAAAAVALGMLAITMAVICYCCRQRAKVVKQPPSSTWIPLSLHRGGAHSASLISKATMASGAGSYGSLAGPSSMGRVFTFSELMDATRGFDEALVIGVGGFGKVYQGDLDDGTHVAVKRGNPRSEQGIMEFQTEIDMLSKLRHRHLVSLIGYCKENREMILVYEFMANGPLRSHLYGSNTAPLSWRQRLEICVGAARGLHYLHTGATESIIHRDVKTTNILLDENLVAKVSDFGLSKTGPALDQTHVSTAVKGSFGYLDPEYFRRQQLTEKSDVYSFGVVLMEVICARPAINPALPREQVNIAEWAMHWQTKGMLDHIIDPHLVGTVDMNSLAIFGKTAEKCLAEDGVSRPPMGQVLWNLEYALQLQHRSIAPNENIALMDHQLPMLHTVDEKWEESMQVNHSFSCGVNEDEDEAEDITMSAVFSQMVRPTNDK